MKNKKFVAFLDILGFSKLVENNSHDYLVKEFEKFLFFNQYNLSRGRTNNNATNQDEIFNIDISKVNLFSISDSIILYTNGDSIDDFRYIIDAISTLLNTSIKNGFPLRGGLTYGDFSSIIKNNQSSTFNYLNHILLGKALVKAYETEKKQEWSGCVISNECFAKYKKETDKTIIEYLKTNYKILNYNVSMKDSNEQVYVINWIKDATIISRNQVEEAFKKHNKSVNEEVKRKIENTLKFYDYVYKNKYFYNPQVVLEGN